MLPETRRNFGTKYGCKRLYIWPRVYRTGCPVVAVIAVQAQVQFVFPKIVCRCCGQVIQLLFILACLTCKEIIGLGFVVFTAVPPGGTVFPAFFKIKLTCQGKTPE